MSWEPIPNTYRPGKFDATRKGQGMFVRPYRSCHQVWLSAELGRRVGQAVTIYRNGHKFLIRPCRPTDPHARLVTARASEFRIGCKELASELDDGRTYVLETREGFEL